MSSPGHPSSFGQTIIDVHSNYRSGRLSHEPPDQYISDEVTPAVLGPHLVRSAMFVSAEFVLGVVTLFGLLLVAIGGFQALGSFGSEGGSVAGFGTLVSVLGIIAMIAVGVFWIIALFRPLKEPIAEYGLLIEGRANVHAVAYTWILRTAQARQAPFGLSSHQSGRVPVMILTHGRERGMAVVRPVGSDLYMGWTMWRERSTIAVIGHLLREIFQRDPYAADLRSAGTRALRELIHSLVREGVQAAITNAPIREQEARSVVDGLPNLPAGGGPSGPQPVPPYPMSSQPPAWPGVSHEPPPPSQPGPDQRGPSYPG